MDQKSENLLLEETLKIWKDIVKNYRLEGDRKLLIWTSKTSRFRPGQTEYTFTR